MERDLVTLAATVAEGFTSLRRELETDREHVERRHRETSGRLDLINGRVGRAHDRASALEATVGGLVKACEELGTRIATIADRVYRRLDESQEWVRSFVSSSMKRPEKVEEIDESKRPITMQSAGIWIAVIGATVGATFWFLTVLLGFHR